MKDFDAERKVREDREFRIGGRDFRFKPSVQQDLVDAYYDALGNAELSNAEFMKIMDNVVLGGLEPAFHGDWEYVRSVDTELPLMADQVHGVIRYMLEVMLDRPIVSPSDSSDMPEASGTSSTDKLQGAVESS